MNIAILVGAVAFTSSVRTLEHIQRITSAVAVFEAAVADTNFAGLVSNVASTSCNRLLLDANDIGFVGTSG